MTIETSGAISLGTAAGANRSISGEFGGVAPHAISEYYRGAGLVPDIAANANIPTTGPISFSDFYGTQVNFSEVITCGEDIGPASRAGYIAGSLGSITSDSVFGEGTLRAIYIVGNNIALPDTIAVEIFGFRLVNFITGFIAQRTDTVTHPVLNPGVATYTTGLIDPVTMQQYTQWQWNLGAAFNFDWPVGALRNVVLNP